MAKPCCANCVYAQRPQGRWLRIALARWPGMLICCVCADCPGQTCGVYTGGYCRNFHAKPGVPCEPYGSSMSPDEKVCRIPLTQGLFALVDPEDFDELSKYKWYAARNRRCFYACRRENGKVVYMHRQIMKPPPGMDVDHINLQGLDSRKRNMRTCTRAQNGYNHRPLWGGTGFRGVRYVERNGKYEAFLRHRGKEILSGEFDDPIEAARARDKLAREVQGEYAWLNFPHEIPLAGSIKARGSAAGTLSLAGG
jgi:hypothetical protein